MLSKNAEKTLKDFNQDNDFFGYNKTPIIWKHSDKEVIEIHQLLQNHLNESIESKTLWKDAEGVQMRQHHLPGF